MKNSQSLSFILFAGFLLLAAAGCNKEETVTVAETEGIYVTVDDLKYQIQISRILNPAAPDDSAYLRGMPAGEETGVMRGWSPSGLRPRSAAAFTPSGNISSARVRPACSHSRRNCSAPSGDSGAKRR